MKLTRYIREGREACRSHPDYDELTPHVAATDTIASILHWVEDVHLPSDGEFSADAILAEALDTYEGDR